MTSNIDSSVQMRKTTKNIEHNVDLKGSFGKLELVLMDMKMEMEIKSVFVHGNELRFLCKKTNIYF